jgi:hypothetical protein
MNPPQQAVSRNRAGGWSKSRKKWLENRAQPFGHVYGRRMDDADAMQLVSEWLRNRAQSLRDAAALAESIGPSGSLAVASRLYAARLREAAALLEQPVQILRGTSNAHP